jgi:hypothetical protein
MRQQKIQVKKMIVLESQKIWLKGPMNFLQLTNRNLNLQLGAFGEMHLPIKSKFTRNLTDLSYRPTILIIDDFFDSELVSKFRIKLSHKKFKYIWIILLIIGGLVNSTFSYFYDTFLVISMYNK